MDDFKNSEEKMAQRIQECRKKLDLTQEELGEKLGLQKSAITKYEKGRVTNIKRETIHLMSKLFNVNPTWLMGFDVPIKNEEKDEVKTAARDKKVFDKYSKLDEAKRKIVEALIDSYFDENVEDEED